MESGSGRREGKELRNKELYKEGKMEKKAHKARIKTALRRARHGGKTEPKKVRKRNRIGRVGLRFSPLLQRAKTSII